jgi:nicotinamidase-related amidase
MKNKKLLVIVDMQNDFVTGSLGSEAAQAIVPAVKAKIIAAKAESADNIVWTSDTHNEDYLQTQEGRNLPVKHCIKGTRGWEIIDELKELAESGTTLEKPTFGSIELAEMAKDCDEVELCGLCTDICVITNALLIKTCAPEVKVSVDAACCAGVTPESHNAALLAMKMCQIEVINHVQN